MSGSGQLGECPIPGCDWPQEFESSPFCIRDLWSLQEYWAALAAFSVDYDTEADPS